MKVRLLGTGAADGIPNPFGRDEVSEYAREHGGRDLRTRSAALVDDELKIDLGPDTAAQIARDGIDPRLWSAVIFTHSDDDHIQVNEIQYAMFPFTDQEYLPYTIYGNDVVLAKIERRYPRWPMELVRTRSFETFHHGKYSITPVRARHIDDEDCQNLLIQADGATFLYATDTGLPYEETYEFLRGYSIDALVIECTDGFCSTTYEGHLDIKECISVVNRLRNDGCLPVESRVITTHHSVRGLARHCDLERALAPHGIEPGYDGISFSVARSEIASPAVS